MVRLSLEREKVGGRGKGAGGGGGGGGGKGNEIPYNWVFFSRGAYFANFVNEQQFVNI